MTPPPSSHTSYNNMLTACAAADADASLINGSNSVMMNDHQKSIDNKASNNNGSGICNSNNNNISMSKNPARHDEWHNLGRRYLHNDNASSNNTNNINNKHEAAIERNLHMLEDLLSIALAYDDGVRKREEEEKKLFVPSSPSTTTTTALTTTISPSSPTSNTMGGGTLA